MWLFMHLQHQIMASKQGDSLQQTRMHLLQSTMFASLKHDPVWDKRASGKNIDPKIAIPGWSIFPIIH